MFQVEQTAYASAARTVDPVPYEFDTRGVRFVRMIINVSAAAAPSVVFNIEAYDPASAAWYVLLASAAIVGTGLTLLEVGPGLTPAANVTANRFLPRRCRLHPVHGNANSITYSVGIATGG